MQKPDHSFAEQLAQHFVGTSSAFVEAMSLIRKFALSKAPILIVGETGTGKEFASRAAHYFSERSDAAFVPVNCGALPDALIESELFGHAKGAFTDASRARNGLIREADGGTLFLDELEALSPRGQVILLRFLQDSSFRSVGEEQRRFADVRVIAASNVKLRALVDRGEFRPDLLYRLEVLSIELPPLRERVNDIALLVPHLLAKAAHSEGGSTKTCSPDAIHLLCSYTWPGNVRELEHLLLRAHLLSPREIIDVDDILTCSPNLWTGHVLDASTDRHRLREDKLRAVSDVERRFVEHALARTNGNISEAARLFGMERAALSRMAKKHLRNDHVLQATAKATAVVTA
jgi:DNA-binding NtrC family response regulator